jgi:uncharacterized RDD family membrane protein YckC
MFEPDNYTRLSLPFMNQTDELLTIDTPENVIFDYGLAGLGSRFLAALVDSLLLVLLQAILLWLMFFFIVRQLFSGPDAETWTLSLLSLLAFLFFWGYYIFFEFIWNGQSPGKRLVGIRVIRRDGTPVTLSEVLIRNLVRLVDFLPSFYGLGVVVMFADPRSRRLGDMAAGTLVIHDSGPIRLEQISPAQSEPSLVEGSMLAVSLNFPVEKLSKQDLHWLAEYLQRRQNLSNRSAMSRQVLRKLYQKVGLAEQDLPENSDAVLIAIYQHGTLQKHSE